MKNTEVSGEIPDPKRCIKTFVLLKYEAFQAALKNSRFVLNKKVALFWYSITFKISNCYINTRRCLEREIPHPSIFHFLIFILLAEISFFIVSVLKDACNTTISSEALSNLASSIGSVIGGSVAIVFTLSTFILQSTADLFSTQYLNEFINNKKEKFVFLSLVLLSIISFIISFISNSVISHHILFITLIFVVSCSFYLIYILYRDLRKMINPETTLIKIRSKAILDLQKIKKAFSRSAKFQELANSYNEEEKSYLVEVQYKSYPSWKDNILVYVKQLYEIALRLLVKNEIESSKLAIKFIHDIYLKHLEMRSGSFIKIPASTLPMVYTFDDQNFTTSILEYLESYSNRIIQENRKENIVHLLQIYRSIFAYSLDIVYAKNRTTDNNNPIAATILGYYEVFANKVIISSDINSIWELIKITKQIQKSILQKNDDPFLIERIDLVFEKISLHLNDNPEIEGRNIFAVEVVQAYLDRIILSWTKYAYDKIFWDRLFKNLKKHLILSLLMKLPYDTSLDNYLIDFEGWQGNLINSIFSTGNGQEQTDNLDRYISFLEQWSNFWLDFARDLGLHDNPLCIQVLNNIEENIRIINFIENRTEKNLDSIYGTQFNTLSWYFEKTKQVEKYHSIELVNLIGIIMREIIFNLENKRRQKITDNIIDLYINLVDNLFQKVEDSHGFSKPRVAVKLVPLGVVLCKYHHVSENKVITKINELNDKYLQENQQLWQKMREEIGKVCRPDQYEFCFEINELKDRIFSRSIVGLGIEGVLNNKITEEDWNTFINKIEYCKDIEFIKNSLF